MTLRLKDCSLINPWLLSRWFFLVRHRCWLAVVSSRTDLQFLEMYWLEPLTDFQEWLSSPLLTTEPLLRGFIPWASFFCVATFATFIAMLALLCVHARLQHQLMEVWFEPLIIALKFRLAWLTFSFMPDCRADSWRLYVVSRVWGFYASLAGFGLGYLKLVWMGIWSFEGLGLD